MAHFAQIIDGTVAQVIVVHNNDAPTESDGKAFIASLGLVGEWVQTSYNHRMRKQYAGIGFAYLPDADVFVAPQPYPSWSLDGNHDWQPPTPYPSDGEKYRWSEEDQELVAI